MIRLSGARIVLIALTLMASLASAQQTPPKVQIFGGYSLLHADKGGLTDLKVDLGLHDPFSQFAVKTYFNGWNAEGQYNLGRWVGVAVDASGYSGVPITASIPVSGLPRQSRYSLLVGPVISYRTKSPFTPFGHVLFGWERFHLDGSAPAGAATSVSTSYTDFAMALGGGLDLRVSHRFSIRAVQVDWYRTYLNLSKFYNSAYNTQQFDGLATREKNVRISTGLVVQF
jgi:opacity protein-like surface antigen